MKIYGESKYKGFLIRRNKETKKAVSKHYISAVDSHLFTDKVKVYARDKGSDLCLDYKIGTNKNVDLAIKTWYIERRKNKMTVPFLSWWEKKRLFGKDYENYLKN